MKIDEHAMIELWRNDIKDKKNIFENTDEYKKTLQIAEKCKNSFKNALSPCDYDLFKNYNKALKKLFSIAEYTSYRAGCITTLGVLNLAFDDWEGKAVIKMIDGEPCVCIEDEETAPDE